MPQSTERERGSRIARLLLTFRETFGLGRTAALSVVIFAAVVIIAGVFWFIHSAPPRVIIMTSGPPGSGFYRVAEKYRTNLQSNGVTVKVLPSQGSIENLKRLADPSYKVDIGFVQAGEEPGGGGVKLYSLGSVACQPLLIFYRNPTPLSLLSELAGRKLAIGPQGSGARTLALLLLTNNGVIEKAETNRVTEKGQTQFLDLDADAAAKALLAGNVDAVFLMGDSASSQTMRALLRSPGIQIYDFTQADAYTRRFGFLNKLQLPRGGIDFGRDVPPRDVTLIGPEVELVARASLHPALSDLLLEAAQDIHGKASLLQRQNQYPSPTEHDFKISPAASRYYKSGKRFFYSALPFWLAALVSQVLVAFVPMVLLLIPGFRIIPNALKWRVQMRIYRWYRGLLRVESELTGEITPEKRQELARRLDHIERSVNHMKVPASFADQFYALREHIGFVRNRLPPI